MAKNWGIYTYIAGDNNLSENGLQDIKEMEDAGASKDIYVAVQIDTEGEHDGSIRYEISEPDFAGKCHRVVIERFPEQNTGEPKYLAEFASWAAERYPAKNRLLVVWNHGAGFMHTPTRDIGYDDSSKGDALTMAELRWALQKAGFGDGNSGKLSILGFDACLMNMLEVAYEFAGLADYIVGSQQTEPGDGWPYGDVIGCMGNGNGVRAVCADIVGVYTKYYRKIGQSGVTQSAVHIDSLPTLAAAVDELGAHLLANVTAQKGNIFQARIATQGYEEPTYVDLVDMVDKLEERLPAAATKRICAKVRTAIAAAVVANESYGKAVRRSCGLSIWYPLLRSDYATRRSEYVALRYSANYKNWWRFLDVLLAS